MKFSTYQQSVNPNTINARAYASGDVNAYGTGGKQGAAWSSALGNLAKIAQKMQDDSDANDIMAARSEISQQINNALYSEKGLVTTGKGANAQGLAGRIDQAVNDITQDVAGNYNGRVRYQLMKKYLPQDQESYGKMGMNAENREMEAYRDQNYKTRLGSIANNAGLNYNNEELQQQSLQELRETITSYGQSKGWDGQTIEMEVMGANTNVAKSVLNAYMAQEDWDGATRYLRANRKYMDQNVYNSYYENVNKQQKYRENDIAVHDIFNQFYDPATNHFDMQAAMAKIDSMYGINAAKAGGATFDDVEAGYQKWAGQRMPHGTNGCVEGVVRILGTQGQSDWIKSVQGDTYVPTLVNKASKDNGGPGVVDFDERQLQAGDIIVYGDNDHVVVYAGQGAGDYTYVGNSSSRQQIVKGLDYRQMDDLQPTKIIKTGGSTHTGYDPKRRDAMINSLRALYNDANAAYRKREQDIMDDVQNQLANAGSQYEQLNIINNSGLDSATKAKLIKQVTRSTSGSRSASGRSGSSDRYTGSYTEVEDLAAIKEYQERMDDPNDTITAAEQKRYNRASRRYIYHHPEAGGAELNNKEVLAAINEAKNKGRSYTWLWEHLPASMSDETKEVYLRAAFSE